MEDWRENIAADDAYASSFSSDNYCSVCNPYFVPVTVRSGTFTIVHATKAQYAPSAIYRSKEDTHGCNWDGTSISRYWGLWSTNKWLVNFINLGLKLVRFQSTPLIRNRTFQVSTLSFCLAMSTVTSSRFHSILSIRSGSSSYTRIIFYSAKHPLHRPSRDNVLMCDS